MPARSTFLCLLLALFVGASLRLGAENRVLFDFPGIADAVGVRFRDFGQSGRVAELGGRPAYELSWDGAQQPYCEISLRRKPALPIFIEGLLTVDVFLPEENRATHLAVRLQDRQDEIFQFRAKIPAGVAGWHRLAFPIDMENAPALSWGGKSPDKRLDAPLRFAGAVAGYENRESTGALGLGRVGLEVVKGRVEPVLVTGNPIHLVKTGEEGRLALVLKNPASRPAETNLRYSIVFVGGEGAPSRFEQAVVVPPGGESRIALPPPSRYGIHKLVIEPDNDRGALVAKELSYAYMPPAGPSAGPAKGFYFGISEHPQWYPAEEQEAMADAAAWAGVKVIRDGIDWRRMQPAPDKWDFGSFDRFLDVFTRRGIELAPTYPGPLPAWATAADWVPAKPVKRGRPRPDYGAWAEFVRTFAERYKGRIRFVETWNEPDLLAFANFSVVEYVKLMEIAYAETKKVDTSIVVQSGGFTAFKVSPASSSDPDYLEKAIRAGKGFYDIFAFHGHGSFPHFAPQIPKLVALRESLGDKAPWWANETAVSAVHVGEVGQAEALFQKLIFSWAHGAIGYNWYNLRNKGFDPKNNEHNFGLLTKDFHPKPAYVTYNMLARVFGEAEFVRALALDPDTLAYLFRAKNGDHLLAGWRTGASSTVVRPVVVGGIQGRAALIDLWGNETPLRTTGGVLALPISARPVTLRIEKQDAEPLVVGGIFETQGEVVVRDGRPQDIALTLRNPTSEKLRFDLRFDAPAGVSVEPAASGIVLAAGERRRMTFGVVVESALAPSEREPAIPLNLRAGDLWEGVLDYRIRRAWRVPSGEFGDAPMFTADDVTQVTSLVVNEPSTAHLFWKGRDDLSAKVWLSQKNGELRLKVEVRDDVHVQTHSGADVWLGDGVQLGLLLPGQRESWEIGLSRLSAEKSAVFVWSAPGSYQASAVAALIRLETRRDEEARLTVYEASLPAASIGLGETEARLGFSFNLLVNDNDGSTREGFIALAPGFGRSKQPSAWPVLILE